MKRLHVHVAVEDLDKSVGFYSTLFDASPSMLKDDYAKWMLDDPRVNFAISVRGQASGIDHLGIQVETGEELSELSGRLKAAGETTLDLEAAARSRSSRALADVLFAAADTRNQDLTANDALACLFDLRIRHLA